MKKVLLALLVPGAASAQAVYPPPGQDAPRDLDPGSQQAPAAPARPQAPQPAKPNVVIVGPDGKVTYDSQGQGQQPPPANTVGGYYVADQNAPFGYAGDFDEPSSVHSGPTPELHVVRKGDTLWDLSFFYFNDPWQWPKVWSYNPQITNPHWIYPGDLVRLLPRGMFAQQATAKELEAGPGETKPAENLPAPARRSSLGIKQTAFVEKAELDKALVVDGAVDEKELLSIGDSIYVAYPAKNPPKVGQRYTVYTPDTIVKSGGKEQGAYVRVLGSVEIVSVKQDKKARGVIVEANHEIERGAKIGPLVKEFSNVAPVQPSVDAQGNIIAMLSHEQLIGQGEVIFVDIGKAAGVEVGNRMFVVRRGDAKPPQSENTVGQDDRRFPARSLGEVVIVNVGEKVSVGLVTLSVQEMAIGDIVMMQKAQ